jgi:hypothetical protein
VAGGQAVSERIAITTIVRSAGLDVPSGWLRVLSTDRWEQLAMAPLPDAVHRIHDTNPRGGLRGGRGVASTADRLAVALNDRVLLLDRDWRPAHVLSHPWMGGVHDIAADDEGLWISCSDNDMVLRLDWDGQLRGSWHWRADRRMRRALGFGWLPPVDRSMDHRDPRERGLRVDLGHVNAVASDGDAVLVGLGLLRVPMPLLWPYLRERGTRLAARAGFGGAADRAIELWRRFPLAKIQARWFPEDISRVTPGARPIDHGGPGEPGSTWVVAELLPGRGGRLRSRVLARHPAAAVPTHNVAAAGGWVVVNETARGRIVALDRETGAVVRSVEIAGDYPFPRGLLPLGDGRYLVGSQGPAALSVVDLAAERVDERVVLPDDRGEAPYAIGFVPSFLGDPGLLPTSRAGWGIEDADASPGGAGEELAPAATG